MHTFHAVLSSLLLCHGMLAAQDPGPGMAPASKPDVPMASLTALLEHCHGLSRDGAGRLWGSAGSYKVEFAGHGPVFHPCLGAEATAAPAVAFALRSVQLGGASIACGAPQVAVAERQVVYEHGAVRQCYELRDDGVEQSFHFASLPGRGKLEVALDVHTELLPVATADGIDFVGAGGGVRYGAAVAIDALGRRCAVTEELRDAALVLTVPEWFVAEAALPLVIDPLVGSLTTLHTNAKALVTTDVIFLGGRNEYWVCFERTWSATDSDVFVVRCDSAMQPVGTLLTVDISTTSWRHARMAGLTAQDRCLVVAEVSTGNVQPFTVQGRIVTGGATPAVQPAFVVQAPSGLTVGCWHPDVGGDASNVGSHWLVAWESVLSPNVDHDIECRRVAHDGVMGSVALVGGSFLVDRDPVVGKANGSGWSSMKHWPVAFQMDQGALYGNNTDVRVAMVDLGGAPYQYWSGPSFPVSSTPTAQSGRIAVSSPLNGDSHAPQACGPVLVVETRTDPVSQLPAIYGRVVSWFGNVLVGATRISPPGTACTNPRVSSDGIRFVVTYQQTWSPSDEDLLATCLAYAHPNLVVHEHLTVVMSSNNETTPCIGAVHEGNDDAHQNRYAIAWVREASASSFVVSGSLYDGMAPGGGAAVRPTGCGGLSMAHFGSAALGTNLGFQLTNPNGLAGLVVGFPVSVPLAICPGCTQGADGGAVLATGYGMLLDNWPWLLGLTISFQGFDIGVGPCLGQIRLSDTVDFTLR